MSNKNYTTLQDAICQNSGTVSVKAKITKLESLLKSPLSKIIHIQDESVKSPVRVRL